MKKTNCEYCGGSLYDDGVPCGAKTVHRWCRAPAENYIRNEARRFEEWGCTVTLPWDESRVEADAERGRT